MTRERQLSPPSTAARASSTRAISGRSCVKNVPNHALRCRAVRASRVECPSRRATSAACSNACRARSKLSPSRLSFSHREQRLAALHLVGPREGSECSQHHRVEPCGFCESELAASALGTTSRVLQRPVRTRDRQRLDAVVGELRQVRREIVSVHAFQGGRDPLVELQASRPAKLGAKDLGDDRMSEPVAVGVSLRLDDEGTRRCLGKRLEQLLTWKSGNRLEQRTVEFPPDHGCGGEQVFGPVGEWAEAAADRRPDRVRDGESSNRSIGVILIALGADQAHDLVEKEGIAVGRLVEGGYRLPIGREPANAADELGDLVDAEPAQWDRRSLTADLREQGSMSRRFPDFALAIGSDDQRADLPELSGKKAQEHQGVLVGGVQVVEHHHQRGASRQPLEETGDRVEEEEALRAGAPRRAGKRQVRGGLANRLGGRKRRTQLRNHLRDASEARLEVFRYPIRPARPSQGAPDQLDPWPEGGRAASFPASPPENTRPVRSRVRGGLLGEPRLADTGFSRKRHQPTSTGCHLSDGIAQDRGFTRASHPGTGRTPCAFGRVRTALQALRAHHRRRRRLFCFAPRGRARWDRVRDS